MLEHTNKQHRVHPRPSYVTSLAAGLLLVACASGVEDHEQPKPLGGGAIGRIAAGANGAAAGNVDGAPQGDDSSDAPTDTEGSVPSVLRVPQETGLADHDGDGIPDRYETKTGKITNDTDVGTDPERKDTDGDGISDGDELYGTSGGLDLPGMGVNPNHRDILLEYDWIDDAFDCNAHSHEPLEKHRALLKEAFADAPIENPDHKNGINLIQDSGQGGLFTGGGLITGPGKMIAGDSGGTEFKNYQQKNMAQNRVGYFHWVLMAHTYGTPKRAGTVPKKPADWDTGSSGNAPLGGYGLMVTLGCAIVPGSGALHPSYKIDDAIVGTIMHELGHNLGLRHGGDENLNGKPNYSSVMNYAYQFTGAHRDCAEDGPRGLDFSRNTYATLDESKLYEPAGICNNSWWDWNGNKKVDQSLLAFDVNGDKKFSKLTGFDDWAKIASSGALVSSKFVVDAEEDEVCPPPPGLENASEDGTDDGSDDGTDDGTDDGSDDGTDSTDDGADDGADDSSDDGTDDGSEE